jgi:phosphatidate cytidylyltransferase
MLRYRLITGPILVAVVIALAWADDAATGRGSIPPWLVTGIAGLVISVLASIETSRLLAAGGVAASVPLSIAAAAAAFAATLFLADAGPAAGAVEASVLLAIVAAGLVRFSRGHVVKGVTVATAGLVLVAIYAGALIAFWPLLRIERGPWFLLGAILLVKSSDIGAYAVGMTIGRHKLIPWLSPGKTREGLAGGVATAALVGAGLAALTPVGDSIAAIPLWLGAVAGAVAALTGQAGDLAESLLKRDAGVKDSGAILPGMGGILDVVDSLLFAGPALYWLFRLAAPVG